MSKEKPTIIIKPHKKTSRKAKPQDAQYIAEQASEMMLLAAKIEHDRKFFDQVFGIHHSQITKKAIDFFVLNPTNERIISDWGEERSYTIINPVIVNHTRHTVDSVEGCLSFAGMPGTKVQRYNKITVQYNILEKDKDGKFFIFGPVEENLGGLIAKIFQHEIDHGQAKYVFDL